MLKNKIIGKKIRNILILLMAIIIMLGAYHNIRNSRAENVIQIEMEVSDKSNILSAQTITVDATETSDGNYLVDLPISVNEYIVTKYYTSDGEEILVDAENNTARIQLTEEEVASQKVQLQTDYDTKEVTYNDETKLFYNKELKNIPNEDGTENQDVTVTGYMPLDAKLEVTEIDLATLTSVKIPNENETMQKAYDVSVFEMVEKQTTETDITNTDDANTDNNNETIPEENNDVDEIADLTSDETIETAETTTEENVEMEKVEYDPSVYGEKIIIKTKYAQKGEIIKTYNLVEDNNLTEIENTVEEDTIKFEIDKTEKTLKYIIATEPKPEETNILEENNTTEENNTSIENTEENTSEGEPVSIPNEIENSEWEVIDSKPDIPNGKATVVVKGPDDGLKENWVNVILNGERKEDGIAKEITSKEKVSDGIQYTITITGIPQDTYQMKIELEPKKSGIQMFTMSDDITASTTANDSGVMLAATTYNTLKSASSETAADSGFLGNTTIQRQNIQQVEFSGSSKYSELTNGIQRNFSATKNTSSGHSNSTTTWKDLSGNKDGSLNGGTWGSDYLKLDGVDDWVNLGQMSFTDKVTLEAVIEVDKIETSYIPFVIGNINAGGVNLSLPDGKPRMSIIAEDRKSQDCNS